MAIHYEGTPRDEEYAFGLRVLIKSLKLTKTEQDIVVLVCGNVSFFVFLSLRVCSRDVGARVDR